MKTIVHVNRQHIAMNAKDGKNRPVYTVKQGGKTTYCTGFTVLDGKVEGIYNGTQLKCGARAWLEVAGRIELINPMTFKEARVYENNE